MQTRSQFLPACLNPCLLALTEEFSDARYVKYVLTTNDVIHLPIAFTIINKNYFHTVGFHMFSRCWSTLFTKVYSNAESSLKKQLPPVGHMVGHRVGHEVGHGLHHDLGYGLPHVLSTLQPASPSFSSPAVSLPS